MTEESKKQQEVDVLEKLYSELQVEWAELEKDFELAQNDIRELLDKVKIKHALEHIMKHDA
jgi:hypothetical protein